MKRVGLVGWRGMVGSVLMQRMREEDDFAHIEPVFFTTSNVGGKAPDFAVGAPALKDAKSIDELKVLDIIISCQGGDYTTEVFPKLREAGWKGHWIDAASSLRMKDDCVIILDPVNMDVIKDALANGGRNWIGGNCTVSLMLMALGGLFALTGVLAALGRLRIESGRGEAGPDRSLVGPDDARRGRDVPFRPERRDRNGERVVAPCHLEARLDVHAWPQQVLLVRQRDQHREQRHVLLYCRLRLDLLDGAAEAPARKRRDADACLHPGHELADVGVAGCDKVIELSAHRAAHANGDEMMVRHAHLR